MRAWIVLFLATSACATGYHKYSPTDGSGWEVQALIRDVYVVHYRQPSVLPHSGKSNAIFTLYRAAALTSEVGRKYFVLTMPPPGVVDDAPYSPALATDGPRLWDRGRGSHESGRRRDLCIWGVNKLPFNGGGHAPQRLVAEP